ncbi:hypothetical protein CO180_03450 [candidate division WWE3 bacterium CG_4_9_14_3_um_filter_41_6]|uniref:Transcriptional repressor PaaX-like central Cas2-like domain-containing protein n=1 Tax=candidate division WWE3 bacterium CG_4_10_14_0_2_um_filter_41_14 TaxID=1975072 RepID=A0A2M7TEM0_UNCKA|nr:MAG: hypothetical protein COY32_07120 [candidate division WWE3 bacterium CG_4_10_14_0_2_um_filter_41_14]PJA38477.1 MAG: hypothetical protein CO180_03450 [candidate division WWE3 bacterium CG_4_9_14_3_um_filter_41_6]
MLSTTAENVLLVLSHQHLVKRITSLVFTPYEALYATLSPTIYHDSSIRHAVTELESQKHIEKITRDGKKYITLTEKGINFTKSHWAFLTEKRTIDGSLWYLTVFDIPEAKRTLRDELRKTLTTLGFQSWQRSCYILPAGTHSKQTILSTLGHEKWNGLISVVTVNSILLGQDAETLLANLWKKPKELSFETLVETSQKARDQIQKKAANIFQKNAATIKLQDNLGVLFSLIESCKTNPLSISNPVESLSLLHLICETLQTTE